MGAHAQDAEGSEEAPNVLGQPCGNPMASSTGIGNKTECTRTLGYAVNDTFRKNLQRSTIASGVRTDSVTYK